MKLRTALPILTTWIGVVAGLSCADIGAPSRSQPYEWRRIVPTSAGTSDTLSFHWPRERLPVRIWTRDTLDLPQHVQNGVAQWKAVFLYGEFDAVSVSDSNTADVIVSTEVAVKGGSSISRIRAIAPECEGGTDFELPPDTRELQVPVRVFVRPRFDPGSPGVSECMALTTTHELGHALGIFAHSPNDTDIMYFDPVVATPSPRDRDTAERAYHLTPNLTIADR